ncbi:MAG TPA: RNA polymerase sigma factor SigF [Jiangellaceae bacterium]|nr:RNA polymerase sigma factor SigF [Jiangellaceae bacterium]
MLLQQLGSLGEDDPRRRVTRDRLVTLHLPLVEHLARRFRNRGEPYDDLVQVATIGLIKAIDRYDPERGVEFSTYATPTIVGEIKRWFRDKGWAIRVPRRLQEMRLAIGTATATLTQDLGRSPTVSELAQQIGASEDEILEGLESASAYSTLSLDAPDGLDGDGPAVLSNLGKEDEAMLDVENREALKPLLSRLTDRERRILMLRFFAGMTQSQIAGEVGISQMHVSRLLARTLAKLREGLLED